MNGDIIGYAGTGVLTITMIPQVYKTFRERRADDISIVYLLLQIVANILFILYGFCIHSIPIIVSNCVVISCSMSIVLGKFLFRDTGPETYPLVP